MSRVERLIVRKWVVSGRASGHCARPLISGDVSLWQPVAALPSGWLMVTIKGRETLNGFSLPLRVSAGRLVLISWQRPSFLSPAPPIKFLPSSSSFSSSFSGLAGEEAGDSGDVNKVEVGSGNDKADVNGECHGGRVGGLTIIHCWNNDVVPKHWAPSKAGRGDAALCVILDLHCGAVKSPKWRRYSG